MELQQYLKIFRDYWRSIVATLLLVVAAVAGYTVLQTPVYNASASVFVIVESGETAGELSQGASYAERQVQSFVQVTETAVVLQPVIDELGMDTTPKALAGRISVTSPNSTSLISVSVSGTDPAEIAELTDAVAASLVTTVNELSPTTMEGQGLVRATVIDPAVVPSSPSAPKPLTNLVLGIMLGALLGYGQALLRSVLDTRIRTTADLEEISSTPVLATIGHVNANAKPSEQHAHAEAYRRLRTNISFIGLGGERRSSLVITSTMPGEGKTQTSVNLAKVLAQSGDSVLLIDADLRRPQVAARLGLDSELGLADVLTRRGTLADLTIPAMSNLWVLPAGTVPPNPSELLGSKAMESLLQVAEREFDHVIIDTPPVLPVTDATILASRTGGAILVTRANQTRDAQVEATLETLETGSAEVVGFVLNDVSVSALNDRYGYYSEYSSGTKQTDSSRKKASLRPRHEG
ncbi:polysaccharide biosynthesis tyrosine autokinase [Flaviflexus equikiangi]|uniref:polysaccharide biosynthesis tyrosine autokinase n=1 Tax=Flaviflexus equikiangi TaxID=2758573 RepID=UPI0015F66570|nr:polysaccharide biosynthesis tyrosine autokinase [Flaviflexus equikiangi]